MAKRLGMIYSVTPNEQLLETRIRGLEKDLEVASQRAKGMRFRMAQLEKDIDELNQAATARQDYVVQIEQERETALKACAKKDEALRACANHPLPEDLHFKVCEALNDFSFYVHSFEHNRVTSENLATLQKVCVQLRESYRLGVVGENQWSQFIEALENTLPTAQEIQEIYKQAQQKP